MQPTRNEGRAIPLLLDFAPDEVYRAVPVARSAVGSYPTFSPLPGRSPSAKSWSLPSANIQSFLRLDTYRRYLFCGPVCRLAAPGCYPASCSPEPGLSSAGCPAAMARPACPTPYSLTLRRRRLLLLRRPVPRASPLRSDRVWQGPCRSGNTGYGCSTGRNGSCPDCGLH